VSSTVTSTFFLSLALSSRHVQKSTHLVHPEQQFAVCSALLSSFWIELLFTVHVPVYSPCANECGHRVNARLVAELPPRVGVTHERSVVAG
jgi:hypothetical protein